MAQFAIPDRLRSDPNIILVGEDGFGCWSVEDNHGLIRGRFRSRDAAVRFARSERDLLSGAALVLVTPALVQPTGAAAHKTASSHPATD